MTGKHFLCALCADGQCLRDLYGESALKAFLDRYVIDIVAEVTRVGEFKGGRLSPLRGAGEGEDGDQVGHDGDGLGVGECDLVHGLVNWVISVPGVHLLPSGRIVDVSKFAPVKSARNKFASVKSAFDKSASDKSAPNKSAPVKFAAFKSAPNKDASAKSAPVKSAAVKSAFVKFA